VWVDWSWVGDHGDLILDRLREHVELTVLAVVIGMVIAVPLTLVSRRSRVARAVVLTSTGILYTIPSLALFTMLIPWTGLSRTTALVALVSYTLLILVRNAVTGLDAVPDEVRDVAAGLGYSKARSLMRVELPLALPAILAGLRIALTTTVGLAALAFYAGAGGLGESLASQKQFQTNVLLAGGLCVLMAVALDLLVLGAQRILTPWSRAGTA
jgi:osmoprotectant transport system permease protein